MSYESLVLSISYKIGLKQNQSCQPKWLVNLQHAAFVSENKKKILVIFLIVRVPVLSHVKISFVIRV